MLGHVITDDSFREDAKNIERRFATFSSIREASLIGRAPVPSQAVQVRALCFSLLLIKKGELVLMREYLAKKEGTLIRAKEIDNLVEKAIFYDTDFTIIEGSLQDEAVFYYVNLWGPDPNPDKEEHIVVREVYVNVWCSDLVKHNLHRAEEAVRAAKVFKKELWERQEDIFDYEIGGVIK